MIGVVFDRDIPIPPRPEPKVPSTRTIPDLDLLARFPPVARARLAELRDAGAVFTPEQENRLIALAIRVGFTDFDVEPYKVAPLARG